MNYTIQTPDYTQGIKRAYELNAIQAQENAFLAQAEKARQEQQAMIAQQEENRLKQQELMDLSRDPTSKKVQEFIIRRPEFAAQFKDSYANLSDNEKKAATEVNFLIKSGLEAGKGDVVLSELERRIDAAKNSGDAMNADRLDILKQLVIANPNAALLTSNAFLASTMDPDKFATMEKTRGEETRARDRAPVELRKAEAEATTAEVKAKYAEPQVLRDMEEQGWKIEGIKADINFKRLSTQIAAMNAALAREDNAIKRAELQQKIEGKQAEIEQKARETQVQVSEATSTIDDMLRTLDKIEKNPQLGRVVGVVGGRVNTAPLNNDAIDAIALIESFSSQAFMTQREKLKGAGAITDFEGQKAAESLANLTRKQSQKQFLATIEDARRKLLRGRAQIEEKYGVPKTIPDTPTAAGGVGGKSVDEILTELGVGR